jgi:murein DD-endopeptidase MepM/ murein hydrolase activator NlpD
MRRLGPPGVIVSLIVAVVTHAAPTEDLPPPPGAAATPPQATIAEIAVRRGDTWEALLSRFGLSRPATGAVISTLRSMIITRRLLPGQIVRVTSDADGEIVDITYERTPIERYVVTRDGDSWTGLPVRDPIETRMEAVAGSVEGSLFNTMDALGETPALTVRFVRIFESEFDFSADALSGDRFRMLVEKQYAQGRLIGYGSIPVAEYRSAGRRPLIGVLHESADGRGTYYDPQGRSLRKMFLRSPLDFTRITSGFSHARRHPVLGGVRPHRAIDYAAPVGTPVRAVSDGVVRRAGWDGGSGLSIRLRHARGYETMYNHLSKIHIRKGQRVRQRQIIGRVGSTGLSTGPHLDYRVIKNGKFVNPLGEKFVPGAPLSARQRRAFQKRARAFLERLDRDAPDPGALRRPSRRT